MRRIFAGPFWMIIVPPCAVFFPGALPRWAVTAPFDRRRPHPQLYLSASAIFSDHGSPPCRPDRPPPYQQFHSSAAASCDHGSPPRRIDRRRTHPQLYSWAAAVSSNYGSPPRRPDRRLPHPQLHSFAGADFLFLVDRVDAALVTS